MRPHKEMIFFASLVLVTCIALYLWVTLVVEVNRAQKEVRYFAWGSGLLTTVRVMCKHHALYEKSLRRVAFYIVMVLGVSIEILFANLR